MTTKWDDDDFSICEGDDEFLMALAYNFETGDDDVLEDFVEEYLGYADLPPIPEDEVEADTGEAGDGENINKKFDRDAVINDGSMTNRRKLLEFFRYMVFETKRWNITGRYWQISSKREGTRTGQLH